MPFDPINLITAMGLSACGLVFLLAGLTSCCLVFVMATRAVGDMM